MYYQQSKTNKALKDMAIMEMYVHNVHDLIVFEGNDEVAKRRALLQVTAAQMKGFLKVSSRSWVQVY